MVVENIEENFVLSNPNKTQFYIFFVSEDEDPLLVVITGASIVRMNNDGSFRLAYDIQQLRTQGEVSSIEELMGLDCQDFLIFVDDVL